MSCSRIRIVTAVGGICLLLCAVGCGKSDATAEVSGTIKRGGKVPKLERFQIAFQGGRDNRIVTAPIAVDGRYTASGVPVGDVKVGFIYQPPEAAKAAKGGRLPLPAGGKAPTVEPAKEHVNPIPLPLRDPSTSNLSLVVEGGKANVFDHDIPSGSPKP